MGIRPLKKHMEEVAAISPRSFEALLLEHGRFFDAIEDYPGKRGPMGHCFQNAGRIAVADKKYLYVEGYANLFLPLHHAWLYNTETGCICDPTWREVDDITYCGIVVARRPFLTSIVKLGGYSLFAWPHNEQTLKDYPNLDGLIEPLEELCV